MKLGDFKILCASLKDAGLPEPVPEWEFSDRRYRADVAWPMNDPPLAMEVDGGIYGIGKRCPACGRRRVGAHSSTADILRDIAKTNEYALQGWRLIRVPFDKLHTMDTVNLIRRALVA